ncbi:small ribosomal subunit protein mS33-like [Amphiura filiformis]|uniref:small ribosomal subunit protein mS33-like n=1 Tax=Amphiura filiformis TaxID=82378 RepID=UPI003B2203DB
MASNYARRMARLSSRIFGEVYRPTTGKSMKVVKLLSEKPREQLKQVVDYYPPHIQIANLIKKLRFLGLFRDEHADFKEEMDRMRKAKGKGKPKKGEGKRAQKRK